MFYEWIRNLLILLMVVQQTTGDHHELVVLWIFFYKCVCFGHTFSFSHRGVVLIVADWLKLNGWVVSALQAQRKWKYNGHTSFSVEVVSWWRVIVCWISICSQNKVVI